MEMYSIEKAPNNHLSTILGLAEEPTSSMEATLKEGRTGAERGNVSAGLPISSQEPFWTNQRTGLAPSF